jgi:hypothetical protein
MDHSTASPQSKTRPHQMNHFAAFSQSYLSTYRMSHFAASPQSQLSTHQMNHSAASQQRPVIFKPSAGIFQSEANVLQRSDSVQSVASYLLSREDSYSSVAAASDKPKVNRTLYFIAENNEGSLTYSDGSSSSDDSYPNSQGTFSDCDDELMDDLEYFAEELDATKAGDVLDISLLSYLRGCGLPYFLSENHESLEELKHLRYALPWPACPSLRRQPGTRHLRQVKSNWRWPEISNVVRNCELLQIWLSLIRSNLRA